MTEDQKIEAGLRAMAEKLSPSARRLVHELTRPAPELGSWQERWDGILHGTNPCVTFGTRRLEWSHILDMGMFAGKFNALYSLLESMAERVKALEAEAGICQCGAIPCLHSA